LQHQKLPAVWTNGVFSASSYPLKSPEKAVEQSDFGIAGVARWLDTGAAEWLVTQHQANILYRETFGSYSQG
jgi:hypothetical protein